MPSAVGGLTYTFIIVDTTFQIDVKAATGDTIRVGSVLTAAGGTISSAAAGNSLTLVAIDASSWLAIDFTGSWT